MRFYTMAVMGLALGVLALAVPTAVRAAPIVVGNLDVDYGVSMPGTTFHLSNLSNAPFRSCRFRPRDTVAPSSD